MKFNLFLAGIGIVSILIYQLLSANFKNTYIVETPSAASYMAYQSATTTLFSKMSTLKCGRLAHSGIKSYSKGFDSHQRIASNVGSYKLSTLQGVEQAFDNINVSAEFNTGYEQTTSTANVAPIIRKSITNISRNVLPKKQGGLIQKIELHGFYAIANSASNTEFFSSTSETAMQRLGSPETEGDNLGDAIPVGEGIWTLLLLSALYIPWKKRLEVARIVLLRYNRMTDIINRYPWKLIKTCKQALLHAFHKFQRQTL